MPIEIRHTKPDEGRAAADTFRAALLSPLSTDADWANPVIATSWAEQLSVSGWDGAQCVGHAGAFPLATVVPGGAVVPAAGVSRVGVRQTHTRRGVLTGLMQRLLRDSAEQGKVFATLRASEAVIYNRFGFAVANDTWSVEIDVRRPARVVAPVATGSIRILDRPETLATIMALHARIGLDRPGAVVRAEWMHQRYLADALELGKPTYVVVHSDVDGVDDGWAQYTVDWPDSFAQATGGQCEISELWGASPAVELALWQFIFGLDLVDRVRALQRPTDDAVKFGLDNQRAYQSKQRDDEQWLRLIDVDAALRARTYNPGAGAVTVAVSDPLFPANDGTWRISADGAERVDTPADAAALTSGISGISAAYLGGTAWHDLLVAGQVHEQRPGAVALADVLFASRPLPRCGSFF